MLAYDPKQRITIAQIKKHAWFNAKFLEGKELIRALRHRHRHREMETKRRRDARKIKDLQVSVTPQTRSIDEEPIIAEYFGSQAQAWALWSWNVSRSTLSQEIQSFVSVMF